MQLAGGGGDEDVVHIGEISATGERLAESGERESNRTANGLSEDGGPHRLERVVGPPLRPPDRHQPVLLRSALNLALPGLLLVRDTPRPAARLLPNPAEQNRLPNRHNRKRRLKPLSSQIRVRRPKVVIEDRLVHSPSV